MSGPIAISWSGLRAHLECTQRSALLRAGKRAPTQNLRNYFHGMVVDSVMRDWLDDPQRRPGTMPGRVEEYITRMSADAKTNGDGVVRWKHPGDRAELHEFCVELLHRLEPILTELVLPHRFVTAHRFAQPVAVPYLDGTPTTVILRGETDLLTVERPGRLTVWDLKGTRDDSYWRKVTGQLVFYDLAMLAATGQPTTRVGLIQPMCTQPVVHFTVTEDQRRQVWAAITRMATDIWRGEATCRTDTDRCFMCEVSHACPRYDTGSSFGAALRHAARTMEVTR